MSCNWSVVINWIEHLLPKQSEVVDGNSLSPGIVATPDLMKPYVVLCHSRFQDHGCDLPMYWAAVPVEQALSTAVMLQAYQ